jgi:hypothetical protein
MSAISADSVTATMASSTTSRGRLRSRDTDLDTSIEMELPSIVVDDDDDEDEEDDDDDNDNDEEEDSIGDLITAGSAEKSALLSLESRGAGSTSIPPSGAADCRCVGGCTASAQQIQLAV